MMKRRFPALLLTLILALGLAVPARAAGEADPHDFVVTGSILWQYRGKGGEVTIPQGITAVGSGAFDQCTTLSSVVIPEGVTYIGINAFRDCISLTRVSFPSTLEEIDSGAFTGCIRLTGVDLPDSVTKLGDRGRNFAGCTALKHVTLSRGLTSLPYAAFANCTELLSVTVPDSVATFNWPFTGCPKVTLCGREGSPVQLYASEIGLPFSTSGAAAGGVAHFTDVSPASPYAAAILWGVSYGITAGTSATTFSPDAPCTAGQMLTFLWRINGSPKANKADLFDIAIPEGYKQAVLWAYEKALVGDLSMNFHQTCTRRQAISWLWKLAGSPPAFPTAFQDLTQGSEDYIPACWAVNNGVLEKDAGGRFSPDAPCTRGQALTYLYQATGKSVPGPEILGERPLAVDPGQIVH